MLVNTQLDLLNAVESLKRHDILELDTEFNTLDVHRATIFLIIIGTKEEKYSIDARRLDITPLNLLNDKTVRGHNIAIDIKILKLNGVSFNNVICTMIAEQRLTLGSGLSCSLANTLARRLEVVMEKEVRNSFITNNPAKLRLNQAMVDYAEDDINYLEDLYKLQKNIIDKHKMSFLIEMEFKLIPIMVDCELEGFVFDKEKWIGNIKESEANLKSLEEEMDKEILSLCKGDKEATLAFCPKHNQTDLFGGMRKVSINYASSKQIKKLFELKVGEVPKLKEKETVGLAVLEAFRKEKETVLDNFLDSYVKRSKVAKELSTYGYSFINMLKPTGKIHTVFKQCFTDTGRFSSGNTAYGYPNFQNIPRNTKFRHCFGTSEDREITTCDLSGAELIVMCSLSGDKRLLELSTGDMHSHMANLCWKEIYKYRGLEWTDKDVISKEQNSNKRTDFKAVTFGVIYGLREGKLSEYLKIDREEAAIVIEMIKDEIPVVISMVEAASKKAINDGYIVHNSRTNSRRYYPVVDQAKTRFEDLKRAFPNDAIPDVPFHITYNRGNHTHIMDFKDRISVESTARNTRIQG